MSLKFIWNKIYWFFARPLRTLYRFVFRPKCSAVKVLVKCDESFLLVRPTYAHRLWTIPGGAVERGETFEEAACRELSEETGIIADVLSKIGDYEHTRHYLRETVRCFVATRDSREVKIDNVEIGEAGWFRLDELPRERTSRVDEVVSLYKKALA